MPAGKTQDLLGVLSLAPGFDVWWHELPEAERAMLFAAIRVKLASFFDEQRGPLKAQQAATWSWGDTVFSRLAELSGRVPPGEVRDAIQELLRPLGGTVDLWDHIRPGSQAGVRRRGSSGG